MKRFIFSFKLIACLIALLCLTSGGYASPQSSTENNVHAFCLPLDFEDLRARDSIYAATKHALNLNVGEPRTVRMIYFLPNDRPFQQEVVDAMKGTIRQIQTFYADQMQAHGYGRKTFRFEIDTQGEPMVHRVDGQHPNSYYLDGYSGYWEEIRQKFDTSANNIYLTVWDNGSNIVRPGAAGLGAGRRDGGIATVSDRFRWTTVAHELGHAFGLDHDWRDGNYIMSYGTGGSGRHSISACAAEFLAVHPYFDPDIPDEATPPPTIELISSPEYPSGSTSVSIQLQVSDPDGLHQVILFVITGSGVKACRGLSGEREAIVEFDYDGVIPSSDDPHGTGTSLSNPLVHPIYVKAVDAFGNIGGTGFSLFDVSTRRNLIATLDTHTGGVNSVAFSPDGKTLASGSNDNTVRLWDAATQREITTLTGHTDWVHSVAFSLDGKTLASGSYDDTVKLWDVATQREIRILAGHTHWIYSVAFSPTGSTLASADNNGMVLLWKITQGAQTAALATPDFNGDGRVDFSDFLLFAGQFGLSRDDGGYDARYDLDGDGMIGFGDFLIFANAFGKKGS